MTRATILGISHEYSLTPPTSAGAVLVFIHGWLLSRGYWMPVVQQLAAQHQCLTYDLRGFGHSQGDLQQHCPHIPAAAAKLGASTSPFSLAAYAGDLGTLLATLGLDRVWLVGHSLGGSIALWAALCYPERVQGVICLNAGGGIYLKQEFDRFRQAGRQIVGFRPAWLRYFPLLGWPFTRLMVAQPLAYRWGWQRLLDLLQVDEAAALGALLESTTEAEVHRLPQVVASLRQPAYFMAGAADRVMAPRYVHHLASFHHLFDSPDSNVIELPQCGHMAMVECPQQVADQIRLLLIRHQQLVNS